ncbi:hypothetical protein OF377_00060 [Ureaplasma sp. ES3154-GEN]|uniref:hypothetical protein n=1 Tax=Ureaplasma sp. ES3154-GEN TaxID=2984844 RepID=UPI0021E86342|nr:hypothetical protein [Ureaplasma sp. ES3154-GEN]MCV3743281.1 hypothetical protein [Ureaplasma sp. ES3154-GEN]
MSQKQFSFNLKTYHDRQFDNLAWKKILRDYFNIKKVSSAQKTYNIAMAGLMLAFFLLARFITKNLDFLNGASWQLQMAVLVIGLMVLPNFYYKLFYLLIAPFAMLIFGFGAEPIIGYVFPHYSFALFLFVDLILLRLNYIHKKNNTTAFAMMLFWIFSIVSYFGVWFFYSLQGVLFYGVNWKGSYIYNSVVVFGSLAINIWITLFMIRPINIIKKFMVKQHLKY